MFLQRGQFGERRIGIGGAFTRRLRRREHPRRAIAAIASLTSLAAALRALVILAALALEPIALAALATFALTTGLVTRTTEFRLAIAVAVATVALALVARLAALSPRLSGGSRTTAAMLAMAMTLTILARTVIGTAARTPNFNKFRLSGRSGGSRRGLFTLGGDRLRTIRGRRLSRLKLRRARTSWWM